MAALRGHVGVVALLLGDSGINVNSSMKNGLTPLNIASFNGHHKVVQLLVGRQDVQVRQGAFVDNFEFVIMGRYLGRVGALLYWYN